MALANNDLLIVQKPATKVHYKIKVADLNLNSGSLPDGVNVGDHLEWDGATWTPTSVIDGGTY
jgi:hypothetical protein